MNTEAITLYSKSGCGACVATKRALDKKGYSYETKNVHEDAAAHEYVTKKLGAMAMPVVETDSEWWSGFNPDKINKIK